MIFSTLSSAVPRRLSLQGSAGRTDAQPGRGNRDEQRGRLPYPSLFEGEYRMRIAIPVLAVCILLLFTSNQAISQYSYLDAESEYLDDPSVVVNRPANVQGLTGLIITNSAYTQPKGRIVIGLATIAENSNEPNFSIIQGIATVTAGVTDRIEIGLRAQLIATNLGSSATRETGAGDTDLLFKWRISTQGETLPSIALGLAYTLPTGDESKGFRNVEHEAVRFMVIGTSEQEMPGDYFIGIYFEGQIVNTDRLPGEDAKPYSEKYGVFNAGLLFPLTHGRSLQAIFEYSTVVKKDIPSVYEQNHSSVMPGLRYVTENFNISLGVQFMNREDPAFKDDLRYIGTLNYAF
jgi:hypothetical protein